MFFLYNLLYSSLWCRYPRWAVLPSQPGAVTWLKRPRWIPVLGMIDSVGKIVSLKIQFYVIPTYFKFVEISVFTCIYKDHHKILLKVIILCWKMWLSVNWHLKTSLTVICRSSWSSKLNHQQLSEESWSAAVQPSATAHASEQRGSTNHQHVTTAPTHVHELVDPTPSCTYISSSFSHRWNRHSFSKHLVS